MIATAEPMLQTELWVSFVSMLRSYAAAASLHAGEIAVRSSETDVTIEAADVVLTMRFDPRSSVVNWTKRGPVHTAASHGTFEIHPDGVLSVDGVRRDLDHAAIDFIASITEGAKRGRP